ncbi:MAG: hypothetical protein HC853_00405 [Anaerolineae bacterium]|nr:hypothetical protein [Anaerolineae bacterium]
MTQPNPHTVLICSSPDLRALNRHAVEALTKAITNHCQVVISDDPHGGDALIQHWLQSRHYKQVTSFTAASSLASMLDLARCTRSRVIPPTRYLLWPKWQQPGSWS